MKFATSTLPLLLLTIFLSLTRATPAQASNLEPRDDDRATAAKSLSPTRPFTVQAFQSPFPSGQGITGLVLTAQGGKFYLTTGKPHTACPEQKNCGPSKETVFSVNAYGRSYLVGLSVLDNPPKSVLS